MAPSKSPAQQLLEKADKKANSSTGWFSSSSTKYEEAGDLYQQAANAFKMDKLFREAGDAHAREAECREKCQETNEAASAWWNAAKAYKRGFPDRKSPSWIQLLQHLIGYVRVQLLFRRCHKPLRTSPRVVVSAKLPIERRRLVKSISQS